MATSPPSSPTSSLVDSPKSRVLSFFGKLVPVGSILPSSPSSPKNSSLAKLRRRRSNESFSSGEPPLFLLCSNQPSPSPSSSSSKEPAFQMDFDRHQPMNQLLPSPVDLGTSSLVRPGFGASSSSIFEAQKANPPPGFYFTPLKAVDGRIRGLKDFGPVVDVGPLRVEKKVRRGSNGKGQQEPSPLDSSQNPNHFSHRPYTPPDIAQAASSPDHTYSPSPVHPPLISPRPSQRPVNLNRPLPNLPDVSSPTWSSCTYSPESLAGGDECVTPTLSTRWSEGERKKREGSARWDASQLNCYFEAQRGRAI